MAQEDVFKKLVAHCKEYGFVFPSSDIYDGLGAVYDYGQNGVELKNNVKRAWWQKFIQESPYNVGVDCAILMNSQTWVASGHLGGFSDPLMDCKSCKERFRADKLIEDYMAEHNIEIEGSVDGWSQEQMKQYIDDNNICCPSCGKHDFTDIRQFNLMFKTFQGVTEDAKNEILKSPRYFQYQYNKISHRISFSDIMYFQSDKRVTYIVTKSGSQKCYEKLNNIEKKLCESGIHFYRTHQSFLVNPKFVSIYSYDTVELLDGTTLTVSENRRKKVNELFCALKGEDIIV